MQSAVAQDWCQEKSSEIQTKGTEGSMADSRQLRFLPEQAREISGNETFHNL